jgi:hypothetical protein
MTGKNAGQFFGVSGLMATMSRTAQASPHVPVSG